MYEMAQSIYPSIFRVRKLFKLHTFFSILTLYLDIFILIYPKLYYRYSIQQLVASKLAKCCLLKVPFLFLWVARAS